MVVVPPCVYRETVTIDTVSHEGIVEDHGRDPRAFFGEFGVAPADILSDAADIGDLEKSGTVSLFCPVSDDLTGSLAAGGGRTIRFPLAPFLGLIGVTPAGETPLNSVPPGPFGGNIDIKDLVEASPALRLSHLPGNEGGGEQHDDRHGQHE